MYFISDLPSTDFRLDSFCIYLLRNEVKDRLLEMCLLEQFSLPGLDAQNDHVSTSSRRRPHLGEFDPSS